jgi:hypothetical protein
MPAYLDHALLPVICLLVWRAAKGVVLVSAAAVILWSRRPTRRAEAWRLLRLVMRPGSYAQGEQ